MLSPRLGFRKRRVSFTLIGAWYNPSNHGTKPYTSPNRYLARSVSSMATAAAAPPSGVHYTPRTSSLFNPATGKVVASSPTIANLACLLDEEEDWIKQIETEHNEHLQKQIDELWNDYLAALSKVGPHAIREHDALKKAVYSRIAELKKESDDKLTEIVQREREQRFTNPTELDKERLQQIYVEQQIIMDNLKREYLPPRVKNAEEKVKEIQREEEEARHQDEVWNSLEAHLEDDRRMWRKTAQDMSAHLKERRERDNAEERARIERENATLERTMRIVEEARPAGAQLRGKPSTSALRSDTDSARRPYPRLPTLSETSSRVSSKDSVFSDSPTSTGTPVSSTHDAPNKPLPSSSRPVPVPNSDDKRRSASGSYGAASRPAGLGTTPSPSPLSGTPAASMQERWIPPKASHESIRKPTMHSDSHSGKPSVLFGASPAPVPSPALDESTYAQTTPNRKVSGVSSQSQPSSTGPSSPTAPATRPQTLPRTEAVRVASPLTPPRQSTWPQSQPSASPRRDEPTSPSPRTTNESHVRTSSNAYPSSYSFSAMPNVSPPISKSNAPSNPSAMPSAQAKQPAESPSRYPSHTPMPSSATKAAPAPAPAAKPTSPFVADPSDSYRSKLRSEYVGGQGQRAEEERRRREEEEHAKKEAERAREEEERRKENERRAEEARKRGENRRRMEEQAREAERRDAEKRARKAGIPIPTGPERPIPELWAAYENQWAEMANSSQLRFRSIPWPVTSSISSPDMIIPVKIAAFVLSPQHSQGKTRKDRLKEALLRWHPDRFETKWLKKVVDEEREMVKEGVGSVVRVLNELLNAPDLG